MSGPSLNLLATNLPAHRFLQVPPLGGADQTDLVDGYLGARRKRLTPDQRARLLDPGRRPEAGLPLYLAVALEELCLFGDHQALDQRIDSLPPTLPELFAQVLDRLSADHPDGLAEGVCCWLASSRGGLSESELLALLRRGAADFPAARWVPLYRGTDPCCDRRARGGPRWQGRGVRR